MLDQIEELFFGQGCIYCVHIVGKVIFDKITVV